MQLKTTAKLVIEGDDQHVPVKIWTKDIEPEAVLCCKGG